MSNFKIGDAVQRKTNSTATTKHLGCGNNGAYTVTAVSNNGAWIQLDGWDAGGKDHFPWYCHNFVLVEADTFPPAPESVLYNAHSDNGCNLEVTSLKASEYYDAHIRVGVWNNCGAKQGKVTCLTPDAALQLAHDLRRMAMEIRRKECNGN